MLFIATTVGSVIQQTLTYLAPVGLTTVQIIICEMARYSVCEELHKIYIQREACLACITHCPRPGELTQVRFCCIEATVKFGCVVQT